MRATRSSSRRVGRNPCEEVVNPDGLEVAVNQNHGDQPQNAEPNNEELEPPPKKTRRTFKWVIEKVFGSEDEVQQFFANEPFWRKETTKCLQTGKKTQFYCNQIRHTGVQCPARIYIWQATDNSLSLMRNGEEHQHDLEGQTQQKIPLEPAAYARIKELVELRQRPRMISHLIREDDRFLVKPDENQVRE